MGHLSYGIPVLKLLGIEAYSKRSEIANGILFRMHSRDRNRRVQLQMTVAFPNLQSRSSSIFSSSNTIISESNVITRFKKNRACRTNRFERGGRNSCTSEKAFKRYKFKRIKKYEFYFVVGGVTRMLIRPEVLKICEFRHFLMTQK